MVATSSAVPSSTAVGRGERRRVEAEHGVEVGAERVGVADDDLAPELREVDAEVDAEQRLADAAAPAADDDDAPGARAAAAALERGSGRVARRGGVESYGSVKAGEP